MRRRHVIGVHRISSNNALAWHYAMMMSVMMMNNNGRHSRHELLLLIVSSNAVEPTDVRRSSRRSWNKKTIGRDSVIWMLPSAIPHHVNMRVECPRHDECEFVRHDECGCRRVECRGSHELHLHLLSMYAFCVVRNGGDASLGPAGKRG